MTTDAAINQALAYGFAWLGVQLVFLFGRLILRNINNPFTPPDGNKRHER